MSTAELPNPDASQDRRMVELMSEIRNLGDRLREDTEDGFQGYLDNIKRRAGISRIDQDVLVSAAETYVLLLQSMAVRG